MKLLLTSNGLSNKSISTALLDLVGRPFSECNAVFIPTAANVEAGHKDWLIKDLSSCVEAGFKEVDIVDISAVPKDVWLPRLENADVLMFGGGNTFHLMRYVEESGLKEILPELLKPRVYVGISAGSVIAGKSLDMSDSERLYSEEIGEYKKDEGLGFVDFLVRPHLNSEYFPKMRLSVLEGLAKEKPATFYALDDNSAIKIDGDKMEIVSEGEWRKFN